ncbi:DUF3524 domain-containing protein [Planctomycetota bacterium]
MNVLALEPYYDGSHRAFLNGWRDHSRHTWCLNTLPGYKWKWRMRHAALTLADQLGADGLKPHAEILVCSDMLNLAEFRGLAPAWIQSLPSVVYFHENQLTYPARCENERDCHFAMTNMTTALAAQAVWFNSDFHQQTFLAALAAFLKRMPDFQSLEAIDRIREKSRVLYPGIPPTEVKSKNNSGPLHILWAARWEHDKNPEDFFAALDLLRQESDDFLLSVIGQSFQEEPPVFAQARQRFAPQIRHWGFQENRTAYEKVLAEADLVVSTALHEFFGIGMIEAIAAGAYPLLPKRLSYPEILRLGEHPGTEAFFYDGSPAELATTLHAAIKRHRAGNLWQSAPSAVDLVKRFCWSFQAQRLDDALEAVCR